MKKRTGCFLIGGLLFLLLLCGGVAAWLYLSSQLQGTRAFVQIRAPESGALTDLNETLPLEVYAEAGRPILRLEVYADGALVAAANGNNRSLSLVQPWTVTTPGRHALVARAFFAADDFADSQVVFVDTADLSGVPISVNVDDLPRGEGVTEVHVGDLVSAAGTTPEELARLNPGLPAAAGAVIPPGTPIRLPRRPSPPPASPPPAVPPPAPGTPGTDPAAPPPSRFEGETHSCSQISIRWSDSPDETGYRLYRTAPGEDFMSLIATLPANTLTYTDTVTRPGMYQYFLAPVRPGGESITSMLSVEIGPECFPAERGATTSLNLLLLSLTTQEAYDGVYCYISFNGSRYERLPAEPGLLHPTSADGLNYELPLQLPSRGLYAIAVPSDGLVRLEGECWGRRGAESLRIGRFSGSHARSEWDGRDLISELVAFEPRQLASAQGTPPRAGGASSVHYRIQPADTRFDLSDFATIAPGALEAVLNSPILTPIEGAAPAIPSPTNVRIENLFSDCTPLPSTDPYIGTSVCDAEVIRSLLWDWEGNSVYTEADITGWRVNVSFMDELRPGPSQPGPVMYVERLNASSAGRRARVPVIPSNYACGGTIHITVTAVTDRGESLPSEPLRIPQPPCRQLGVVRFTIRSISITPSDRTGEVRDDGDICVGCTDRRLELFGNIFIGLNTAPSPANPPSHDFGTILTGSCPSGTVCLDPGGYFWGSATIPWLSVMEIQMPRNQGITLVAILQDYDIQNSRDDFCLAAQTLPARSAEDWTRVNESVVLRSDFGEASCAVEILVEGIPAFGSP